MAGGRGKIGWRQGIQSRRRGRKEEYCDCIKKARYIRDREDEEKEEEKGEERKYGWWKRQNRNWSWDKEQEERGGCGSIVIVRRGKIH